MAIPLHPEKPSQKCCGECGSACWNKDGITRCSFDTEHEYDAAGGYCKSCGSDDCETNDGSVMYECFVCAGPAFYGSKDE